MAPKILIIDDNIEFVNTLQIGLEANGYNIFTAHNSTNGWQEMETNQPNILLLDWEMPDMSGIEFVKLIKADEKHKARYVIMITGKTGTENIVLGLDAGADDYLIKPFPIEELLARIRSGLRIVSLESKIIQETRHLTVLEMALSIVDKIGNPIAAAKLYQQMLVENEKIQNSEDTLESIKSIGKLLDEAIALINQYQSIKNPLSVPAPCGKTMIDPSKDE